MLWLVCVSLVPWLCVSSHSDTSKTPSCSTLWIEIPSICFMKLDLTLTAKDHDWLGRQGSITCPFLAKKVIRRELGCSVLESLTSILIFRALRAVRHEQDVNEAAHYSPLFPLTPNVACVGFFLHWLLPGVVDFVVPVQCFCSKFVVCLASEPVRPQGLNGTFVDGSTSHHIREETGTGGRVCHPDGSSHVDAGARGYWP